MRNIIFALLALFAFPALAVEVPAATPLEFEGGAASAIWTILAGQGVWGALLLAVLTAAWRIGKPHLDAWLAARKLDKLFAVVDIAVKSTWQTYVQAIKEALDRDGKLTEEEKAAALRMTQDAAIAIARTQGVDIVKEYGMDVLNWVIEWAVSKLANENKALKAALTATAPLPDLGPSAPSV